jgi:hypothetical protein
VQRVVGGAVTVIMEGRLSDRIEAMLPEREDFARSIEEITIWLGCTPDQALSACRSLQRFRCAKMKLQSIRQHTDRRYKTTRTMWWRTV